MAGAGNYNVNQAAAGGMQAAGQGTAQAMGFNPNQNVQQYMNPYTDNVVNTTMSDLGRANNMALDQVSSNATKMGAWGGSRHGVAEAETNRAFMDQAARTSARPTFAVTPSPTRRTPTLRGRTSGLARRTRWAGWRTRRLAWAVRSTRT